MDRPMLKAKEIEGVRVRYGFRGRPVVQIKRRLVRWRPQEPPNWIEQPWGSTAWFDAKRDDMPDVQAYLEKTTA